MKKIFKKLLLSAASVSLALITCSCSKSFDESVEELNDLLNDIFKETEVTTVSTPPVTTVTQVFDNTNLYSLSDENYNFPDGYCTDGIYHPEDNNNINEIYKILEYEFKNFNSQISFSGKIDDQIFSDICDIINTEMPEFYWVSGYSWTYNGYTTQISFNVLNDMSPEQLKSNSDKLNEKVDEILSFINPEWIDYEKILFVHDYIVNNTDYDYDGAEIIKAGGHGLFSSAYGCLIEGKAVCQGYADAFKIIMDRLDIECGIASGSTTRGDHAWNYVKIDDEYYWLDVTWDDPSTENNDEKMLSHDYFLLNDELFMKNRISDNKTSLPECSSMKYNYYVYNGLYLDYYSFENVKNIIDSRLYETDNVSIMFSSAEEMFRCKNDLIDNDRIWDTNASELSDGHISYRTSENMNVFTILLK